MDVITHAHVYDTVLEAVAIDSVFVCIMRICVSVSYRISVSLVCQGRYPNRLGGDPTTTARLGSGKPPLVPG